MKCPKCGSHDISRIKRNMFQRLIIRRIYFCYNCKSTLINYKVK
ncbi:hypothetical protein GLP23_18055 [Photobacterium carnosum]|nr:hypothetical protein [Photobacterium carnosum]